jgi:pimeloyl-ACP methyl ester carboxylesterase
MTDITRRTIDTARGPMTWLEAGAGWPLVLLHAFPLTAEMWRPQLERVPADWRFMAPELSSAVPASGERTIDDYAADVGALLDALKVDEAVIGGLSMGGYIAFALFRRSPELFSGMILADTRPQADSPQGRDGRAKMRELVAREGVGAIADQMLPRLLSKQTMAERPELVRRVREIIESNSPRGVDAALDAMMTRPDSTPDLPRMSCATLVIVGEEDAVTPPTEADAMHQAIERSVLVPLAGAAHLSSLEQPDAFSRAIADFLLSHI